MQLQLSKDKRFLNIIKYDSIDELDQIQYSFTKKVKNYRFLSSVKNGQWDGSVSFFDENKNRIPSGLWKYAYQILTKYGYSCKLYGVKQLFNMSIDFEDFKEFALETMKDHEISPRDYQIEAAYNILKYRRCGSLMSTSSGKTLMTFLTIAYGLTKSLMKNILMIVPNVSLVVQGANDFYDYNYRAGIPIKIQQVFHGKERTLGENITIGTYQSLVKFDKEYFQKFDTMIIDEFHKGSSVSIKKIMSKCHHCNYKFGMSGTLPKENTADYLTIIANTGPIVNSIDANSLIEEGFITPVKISVLKLDYLDKSTKEDFYKLSKRMDAAKLFQTEKKLVATNEKRLAFVTNLISKVTKNTLVLFHLIEHGEKLYKTLKKTKGKKVYYVDGRTKVDDRELYKKYMEQDKKKVFYTFETDQGSIQLEENKKVLLSNGTHKKAKNIIGGDDIDNEFLQKYIKSF